MAKRDYYSSDDEEEEQQNGAEEEEDDEVMEEEDAAEDEGEEGEEEVEEEEEEEDEEEAEEEPKKAAEGAAVASAAVARTPAPRQRRSKKQQQAGLEGPAAALQSYVAATMKGVLGQVFRQELSDELMQSALQLPAVKEAFAVLQESLKQELGGNGSGSGTRAKKVPVKRGASAWNMLVSAAATAVKENGGISNVTAAHVGQALTMLPSEQQVQLLEPFKALKSQLQPRIQAGEAVKLHDELKACKERGQLPDVDYVDLLQNYLKQAVEADQLKKGQKQQQQGATPAAAAPAAAPVAAAAAAGPSTGKKKKEKVQPTPAAAAAAGATPATGGTTDKKKRSHEEKEERRRHKEEKRRAAEEKAAKKQKQKQ